MGPRPLYGQEKATLRDYYENILNCYVFTYRVRAVCAGTGRIDDGGTGRAAKKEQWRQKTFDRIAENTRRRLHHRTVFTGMGGCGRSGQCPG